jgi:PTS system glucose-specific IIA component
MLQVWSPVTGTSLAVTDLPDPVFARGMVGPGVAIRPHPGRQAALAPVPGSLVKMLPHAFIVRTDTGYAVLVHLGVDTVQMHGAGFEALAREGDDVSAGDEILTWDPAAVEAAGHSPVCAVVVLDCEPELLDALAVGVDVEPKQLLFEIVC